MTYTKINNRIIAQLKNIVGALHVITDIDTRANFAHDETPRYHSMPEVVLKPATTEEISRIMRLANKHVIPVTPRGGGTCLSGGAIPVHGGIVLSLERMNHIKEIDTDNLMVIVEPGVITENLDKELNKHGLFFPPDPVSLDSCMIGGNIAECAGGPRAMKYGVTKNYVLGIEVVLANGTIQRYGGKLLKNVTGYDIIDLIVGSEGTLAIVTEATLRVLSLPSVIVDLFIPFPGVQDATGFAIAVLQAGYEPAAIEFMEGDVYRMAQRYLGRKLPYPEGNGHVIVEIHGNDRKHIRATYDAIGEIALKHGAFDVLVAESARDREKIWEPRKKASEALKNESIPVAREDLVVPKDRIPELIKRLREHALCHKAQLYAFGHLGDGNIHADVAITGGKDISEATLNEMRKKMYQTTVSLGGMITAEHGIGLSKTEYLRLALDTSQINVMEQIKSVFDPRNILNPGKIFKCQ